MMKTIRSKVLTQFSEIASHCSAIGFRLKILASPLPIGYTVSTLLSRIAATGIMRLVITGPEVHEMGEDGADVSVENYNVSTTAST